MNMNTGKMTRADFESRFLHDDAGLADDAGLTLAVHRHEGLDVEPMTEADVWHCPPAQTPPDWFGRPGRGPETAVEPRDEFDGRATIGVWLVVAVFWIVIVSAAIQAGAK